MFKQLISMIFRSWFLHVADLFVFFIYCLFAAHRIVDLDFRKNIDYRNTAYFVNWYVLLVYLNELLLMWDKKNICKKLSIFRNLNRSIDSFFLRFHQCERKRWNVIIMLNMIESCACLNINRYLTNLWTNIDKRYVENFEKEKENDNNNNVHDCIEQLFVLKKKINFSRHYFLSMNELSRKISWRLSLLTRSRQICWKNRDIDERSRVWW
jgi:hypothetical protein